MAVLGTRGSELALWQAHHVQELLRDRANLEVTIEIIRTAGDRIQDVSLTALPGKGFFTKEIEEALLSGRIDLAVHSHKDLPTDSPPGLRIGAVPERGPAEDCLLVRREAWESAQTIPLHHGAVVGTGSARRQGQLLAARPDLKIRDLRGNVPTRLRKVAQGQYDAIVLAKAGLVRLGLRDENLQQHEFTTSEFLPAPAQGALAIQVRVATRQGAEEDVLATALVGIDHEPTRRVIKAERQLLAAMEGGCNLPLGAHAVAIGNDVQLAAILCSEDGGVKRCLVQAASPDEAAQAAYTKLMS